ncbi:Glycerophosphoryl diester phosphodiesterase family protein [Quadrisphaera granulorum]|uniref:Glycerophosphoryl diester phosphodiesterase family protein n=1 Tax=Quadrisphaera granulorum TaxID=317664 RepID=A0A316AB35_9ACTN|nr:glycerophosphodiester phosphodiesterase family protein [Quadrisphaera granulorum]PWJ54629.1 glycerophosphoryl diester phosphodiesterase family protein [Quadrisphaera granulorum]SZE95991.1 Glycerophosphoryl diester phosphodiesterase family protein [Quadrisphaera granulorum]
MDSVRWTRRAVLASLGLAAAGAAAAAGPLAAPARAASGPNLDRLLATPGFFVAHRGGSLNWPEMSAYAYSRAVALGVGALDVSLSRTSDGVWFGLHDGSLDRTSGTQGFTAAAHTWAEVAAYRITASGTSNPRQPKRPYARLEDLLERWGGQRVLFVDPKAVNPRFHGELVTALRRVPDAPRWIVAKSPIANTTWADLARREGWRSWGFYWAREVDADATLLTRTAASWDLLGLDVGASDARWTEVKALGKPVLAHILSTPAQLQRALALGAVGAVVSDLVAVPPTGA